MNLRNYPEVDRSLSDMLSRCQDLRPALNRSATVIRKSVDKTFAAGGRPPWPPRWDVLEWLNPSLVGKRPLMVSGRLRQAAVQAPVITITKTSLTYWVNLEYAATQQFGGPSFVEVDPNKIRFRKSDGQPYALLFSQQSGWYSKKVVQQMGKWGFEINVRARPFLQFFDEDISEICDIFVRYAATGKL